MEREMGKSDAACRTSQRKLCMCVSARSIQAGIRETDL